MLIKNISKNSIFVTTFCVFSVFFANCSLVSSTNSVTSNQIDAKPASNYSKPQVVGSIKSDEINESSGLVQSRCNADVFWTHNDSGDSEFIYALNEKGEKLGVWQVKDAKNIDWEDIATYKDQFGKCFLYIGDIGNNNNKRSQLTIYKVAEPTVSESDKNSSKKDPKETEPAEAINFRYPNKTHDAETLLVHPQTAEIYVLTKSLVDPSEIYKIGKKAEKIATISVPAVPNGMLTGGEISPDEKKVVLCDYFDGYELILPSNSRNFDEIWKQKPIKIELGKRKQGEAISYSSDSKAIYATSEGKNSPIIKVEIKN